MIHIYHNPRCSKSRETLALVEQVAQQLKLNISVIDYQKTALSFEQLNALLQQLGGDVKTMLRADEDEYQTLQLEQADNRRALESIISHPKLLQRPIVSFQGKAAIGRPPEQVLALFKESI
ncbi:ArsC/Spx/MgsR family protein [Undibacterium sp. RuRC25W]|uniref:ArsC/Spx/MgsR family protein n=1 Tax=Undibacterium sp. RuRC25W TaxID=3413047 RepID=UPI003BF3EF04